MVKDFFIILFRESKDLSEFLSALVFLVIVIVSLVTGCFRLYNWEKSVVLTYYITVARGILERSLGSLRFMVCYYVFFCGLLFLSVVCSLDFLVKLVQSYCMPEFPGLVEYFTVLESIQNFEKSIKSIEAIRLGFDTDMQRSDYYLDPVGWGWCAPDNFCVYMLDCFRYYTPIRFSYDFAMYLYGFLGFLTYGLVIYHHDYELLLMLYNGLPSNMYEFLLSDNPGPAEPGVGPVHNRMVKRLASLKWRCSMEYYILLSQSKLYTPTILYDHVNKKVSYLSFTNNMTARRSWLPSKMVTPPFLKAFLLYSRVGLERDGLIFKNNTPFGLESAKLVFWLDYWLIYFNIFHKGLVGGESFIQDLSNAHVPYRIDNSDIERKYYVLNKVDGTRHYYPMSVPLMDQLYGYWSYRPWYYRQKGFNMPGQIGEFRMGDRIGGGFVLTGLKELQEPMIERWGTSLLRGGLRNPAFGMPRPRDVGI